MQKSTIGKASISEVPSTNPSELRRVQGKRKWAPKSRDGCLICRSRRVKCDEARPSCFRCRRLGLECRYARGPGTGNVISHDRQSSYAAGSQMVDWSRAPSYGTPEETRYLNTFRNLATPWLTRYDCKRLYAELMPQASWSHPGIRHALVAASMASEEYLCHHSHIRPHRREWHYARALQHLYQDQNLNGDIAVMAAVLLWSHDMTMKNAIAALVHMMGFMGMTVMKKMQKLALNRNADLETEVLRGMIGWGHYQAPDVSELPDQTVIAAIRDRIKSDTYANVAGADSLPYEEYKLFMWSTGWVRERDEGSNEEAPDALYFDEMQDFADRWYLEFSSRPEMSHFDLQLLFYYHWMSKFVLDSRRPDQHYVGDDDLDTLQQIDTVLDWLDSIDAEITIQRPGKKDLILPLLTLPVEIERRRPTPQILDRVVGMLTRWDRLEGMWNASIIGKAIFASKIGRPEKEDPLVVTKDNFDLKAGILAARESTADEKEK